MTTADVAQKAGLVRTVAADGSVWWVRPDSVADAQAFTGVTWREPLGVDGLPVPPAAKALPPSKKIR